MIDLDPTTITITRHTKVPDAGGFTTTPTDLALITVRVYRYNVRNQREFVTEEGEAKIVDVGILAKASADIVVGHDSWDTFVLDGRTYRIVGVRPYNTPEQCIQADCVAV